VLLTLDGDTRLRQTDCRHGYPTVNPVVAATR